jgi:hypothetical protein
LTSGLICCGFVFGIRRTMRQKKKSISVMKIIVMTPCHSNEKSLIACIAP